MSASEPETNRSADLTDRGAMDYTRLIYAVEQDTATITFNRPEVRNAFEQTSYREVKHAVRAAELDDDVDFVVLRGAGSDFATGGDLDSINKMVQSGDRMRLFDFGDDLPFNTVRITPKITIAVVQGWCTAGGLCIAAACDIVIASRSSRFAILEGQVGIGDPFVPALLKDRLSVAKLSMLMYTARVIDGVEAERLGLVSEVVDDEELDDALTDMLADLRRTTRSSRAVYKSHLRNLAPPLAMGGPAITHVDQAMLDRLSRWSKE
jgi:enoyl-CoA hydratase/carnithine racemase